MQGSASTTYSTLSRQITGTELQRQQIPGAQLNNEAVNFSFLNPVVTTGKNPYFTQLNQNLGFSIGIGIDIPIFNGTPSKNKRSTSSIKQRKHSAPKQSSPPTVEK
jgi:hypothetical protein